MEFLDLARFWFSVGERRYVMQNWVRDRAAVARELLRHRLSARLRRVSAALLGGAGSEARP